MVAIPTVWVKKKATNEFCRVKFSKIQISNFKFQISNFNWPGLGPVRAVPSVRAVPPSRGQLKFEILQKDRKNRTKTAEKERTKTKKEKSTS